MHPTAATFVEAVERRHGFTPAVASFDGGTKTAVWPVDPERLRRMADARAVTVTG